MAIIQAVRGTKDILPEDIGRWQYLEQVCREVSKKYGYSEIRTPVFEKTEVFSRGVGEETDIVNKEMYTFNDRGGESLTLRPEQTAAIVRAAIQNNLLANTSIMRLFYIGAYYRYERPQKGRLREFHQYGIECLSSPFPESDAEVIMLANNFIKTLGVDNYTLKLNSLGNETTRKKYIEILTDYLRSNISNMSEDSKRRLETNPLRVLDSKHVDDIHILENAPKILDYLDEESALHFQTTRNYLEATGISYEIAPYLVRGLDYYSHTVFEFQSSYLGSQDAFGGGGRYNNLFEELGGKPTPCVGFAMGMERLLLILSELENQKELASEPLIFVIPIAEEQYEFAIKVASKLRNEFNLTTILDLQRRSLKAQLRESDKQNADFALVVGEEEVSKNGVMLKFLKEKRQDFVLLEDLNKSLFK